MGYRGSKKTAYINVLLIAVNILYFISLEMTGSSENSLFMIQHEAMYKLPVMENGGYHRLLTSIFMHLGINHIVNNMLMLFILGDNMGRVLGYIKYLFFYSIYGVGTNIALMAMSVMNKELVVSAGVSGAVFGVTGGLLYAVAVNHGRLKDLSIRQLVAAILHLPYFGSTSGGVDSTVHITGLLIGIAMTILLYKKLKPVYRGRLWEQR